MDGYFSAAPRPLQPADADGARALLHRVLGGTTYLPRVTELLDRATDGDPETQALVVERDGTVAALAIYGPVAGTLDAWHVRALLLTPEVGSRDVGRAMVEGIVAAVRPFGARLLLAELPADAAVGRSISVLRATGFAEEGRVRDYFSDGVALLFLRRDLRSTIAG